MPLNDLADLFHDELRDILSAERQLLEALPKMAEKASSDDLRQAFEKHLEQTRVQVTRVENCDDHASCEFNLEFFTSHCALRYDF